MKHDAQESNEKRQRIYRELHDEACCCSCDVLVFCTHSPGPSHTLTGLSSLSAGCSCPSAVYLHLRENIHTLYCVGLTSFYLFLNMVQILFKYVNKYK